jgi:hypothetical protein
MSALVYEDNKRYRDILIVVPRFFVYSGARNNKCSRVLSAFIILIKLPRHVSASNCYLQGVTRSLQATPHPPEAQTKLE